MSEHSVDGATLAGDPFAAAGNPQAQLLDAAQAALRLLDRMDEHMPSDMRFGGEGRVRKQLRAAIRGARAEAEDLGWDDALDADEAAALDDLRRELGRAPLERERGRTWPGSARRGRRTARSLA